MTTSNYVIREKIFEYNGEYYDLTNYQIGEIVGVYQNLVEAQQAFKNLTVDYVSQITITNYSIRQLFSTEELQAKQQQVMEKIGMQFLGKYNSLIDYLPEGMSYDDAFYFAETVGLLRYSLELISDENYVIWLPEHQQYLRLPDPYGDPYNFDEDYVGNLIWGSTADFLSPPEKPADALAPLQPIDYSSALDLLNDNVSYKYGSLDELSHDPEKLSEFLLQHHHLWEYKYKTVRKIYRHEPTFTQINTLNHLFKEPFFEVQRVNFATLKNLLDQETVREVR